MEANAIAKGGIPTTDCGKPAYIEYTNNATGLTIKVANFNNPDVCPNKGIVRYEAWKKNNFQALRDTHFSCSIAKDKATDVFYGIFNGWNKDGSPKWTHFPLGMNNVWDRSIPTEAQKACILAMSPMTEGSPNYFHKVGVFRLVDEEKAAIDKIQKFSVAQRAIEIAKGLYGEELLAMCWAMEINTTNISVMMMTASLLESAQLDPEKFIRAWEHPNREAINVLNKAIATSVVENDLTKGYTYNGAPLGHNYDFAVKFLLDNPAIMASINMKATESQSETLKAMGQVEEVKKEVPNSSEMEALKKQLAEMKAQNEALLKSQIEGENGKLLNPLEERLEALKAKARKQGGNAAKGLHAYKATEESIAKLEDKLSK